jgi:phage terminase small subunit
MAKKLTNGPKERDEYGLTPKQKEFADLYRADPIVKGNAKRCYQRVNPTATEKTCEVEGAEWLRKPEISAYLYTKAQERGKEADITQTNILREIARLAFFDPRKLYDENGSPLPITDLDDDTAACIAGIKVKTIGDGDDQRSIASVIEYKVSNKDPALEKLMRYMGLYERDNKQKGGLLSELPREVVRMIVEKLSGGAGR